MESRRDTILGMARCMLSSAALHALLRRQERTVLSSVHASSLACFGCLVYYIIFNLFRNFTPAKWGLRTHPSHASEYQDFERKGRPFMTVASVSYVVYGLGSAFYITAYSLSAVSALSTFFFAVSLTVVSYHEIIFPLRSTDMPYKALVARVMVIFLAMLSVVLGIGLTDLQSYWHALLTNNFSNFLWDTVFPVGTCWVFLKVKTSDNVRLGGTWELCEFGIPIMSMLGVMFLVVQDGAQLPISMNSTSFSNQEALTLSMAPFTLFACLGNLMWALFKNSVVDILVGMSSVTIFAALLDRESDTMLYAGLMSTMGAILVRVATVGKPMAENIQMNMLDVDEDEATNVA